jgi:hypothetical protein
VALDERFLGFCVGGFAEQNWLMRFSSTTADWVLFIDVANRNVLLPLPQLQRRCTAHSKPLVNIFDGLWEAYLLSVPD